MSLPKVRRIESEVSVVRDCPGTHKHICCGYKTIDLVEGCPLSCSYCILRGYLNDPGITVRTDARAVIGEIDRAIASEETHVLRFGTGELSDSLALDDELRVNAPIVRFFGERKKALLELKSKWASIDHLKSLPQPLRSRLLLGRAATLHRRGGKKDQPGFRKTQGPEESPGLGLLCRPPLRSRRNL